MSKKWSDLTLEQQKRMNDSSDSEAIRYGAELGLELTDDKQKEILENSSIKENGYIPGLIESQALLAVLGGMALSKADVVASAPAAISKMLRMAGGSGGITSALNKSRGLISAGTASLKPIVDKINEIYADAGAANLQERQNFLSGISKLPSVGEKLLSKNMEGTGSDLVLLREALPKILGDTQAGGIAASRLKPVVESSILENFGQPGADYLQALNDFSSLRVAQGALKQALGLTIKAAGIGAAVEGARTGAAAISSVFSGDK